MAELEQVEAGEMLANARLIAALPEMHVALAACLDILKKLSPWDVDDGNYPHTPQDESDIAYAIRLAEEAIR